MDLNEQYTEIIKPALEDIKVDVKAILAIVQGDGKVVGIVTRVELQRQDIASLKGSLKWMMGIMGTLVVALTLVILKSVFL